MVSDESLNFVLSESVTKLMICKEKKCKFTLLCMLTLLKYGRLHRNDKHI